MFLLGFPLLLIPFAIYNIIVFLMPGVTFADPLVSARMLSQIRMTVSAGDVLVVFAIVLLYIEILKATRIGNRSIVDHVLSLILFIAATAEFMLVPQAATSTFLLLLTVSFVDVVGGFSVTLRGAQRDVVFEGIERVPSNG